MKLSLDSIYVDIISIKNPTKGIYFNGINCEEGTTSGEQGVYHSILPTNFQKGRYL